MEKKRILWIDCAKGLGIFVIVLGHTLKGPGLILRYIYAFNVPLFFLISGLTYSYKESTQFYKDKFVRLMVPYYFFSLVSIIVFYFLGGLARGISTDGFTTTSILPNVFGALYANSRTGFMKWNTPLWFLPCLFVSYVLVNLYEAITVKIENKKNVFRFFLILILLIVEKIITVFAPNIYLPFQFETAILAVVYMEVGILLKAKGFVRDYKKEERLILVTSGIVLASIGLIISRYNGFADMRAQSFGNSYALFLASSIGLTLGVLSIAIWFQNNFISFIGKHTIAILTMHKFPIVAFQVLIPFTRELLYKSDRISGILVGLCVTCCVIFMCIVVELVINRLFIKGRKNEAYNVFINKEDM